MCDLQKSINDEYHKAMIELAEENHILKEKLETSELENSWGKSATLKWNEALNDIEELKEENEKLKEEIKYQRCEYLTRSEKIRKTIEENKENKKVIEKLESKIKEQADKLNKCNSFIRTLKSLSKKGEDISYLLETHNAKYLQMRYNKYDLIFNEFNNYYGVLENTDENIDINYANKQLIDKIEVIFNTEVK